MANIVIVGGAGLIGTLLRYWLSNTIDARLGDRFPYGTLTVNLVGCFLIGFLFYSFADQFIAHPNYRSAVFIGLLGGFTTFSSYGIQTFTLMESGRMVEAIVNVLISNVGGLACVGAGYLLSRVV